MIEATPMIIPHTPNFTPFLPSIKLILEAYRLCQNVMSSYKDFSEHTVSLISFLSFELISVSTQFKASPVERALSSALNRVMLKISFEN